MARRRCSRKADVVSGRKNVKDTSLDVVSGGVLQGEPRESVEIECVKCDRRRRCESGGDWAVRFGSLPCERMRSSGTTLREDDQVRDLRREIGIVEAAWEKLGQTARNVVVWRVAFSKSEAEIAELEKISTRRVRKIVEQFRRIVGEEIVPPLKSS